jgi:hypothetical protein
MIETHGYGVPWADDRTRRAASRCSGPRPYDDDSQLTDALQAAAELYSRVGLDTSGVSFADPTSFNLLITFTIWLRS